MRHLFIFIISVLFTISVNAAQIKGVLFEDSQPLAFANVLLHASSDSSLVKFAYSEDDGSFLFQDISEGNYYLKVIFLGLADYMSAPIVVASSEIDLGEIILKSAGTELSEITITATKPLLEVKADMMVVNVASSVLASGDDLLSLLRKSPGVLVDNNESISILGKSGTVIYIDGKPSPLKGDDLANFLRNMSSDDIESIEIISNPSAKYDAQGSAGIINIKRKRMNLIGFNGSANVALRQGLTTGLRSGLTMNYRRNKLNVFMNGSLYQQDNQQFQNFYREQNNLGFETKNRGNNRSAGFATKLNVDYYLSDKSTVGFIAEYSENEFNQQNTSKTRLGNFDLDRVDSLLLNDGNFHSNSSTINTNFNFAHNFSKEQSLTIDANYSVFDNLNNVYSPNRYTTEDGLNETSRFEIRNITPTTISISSLKADYEHSAGAGKWAAGIKSTLVQTDNALDFYNILGGEEVINTDRSNSFLYDEWVHAGYANYFLGLGKWNVNAGLRIEHSNTTGELVAMQSQNDKIVKRTYTDYFPSVGVAFSPSEKHSFQMSIGRRINRPSYQDLNPFEFQLDELTYEKGNAFLNPEYSTNLQLTHSLSGVLTTTLSYNHTSDVITRIIDIAGLKGSFITWDNLAQRQIYSLGLSSPLAITSGWSTFTNITASHTQNNADLGDGKLIDLGISSVNFYHQHTWKLGMGWSAEASAWYSSPSIWEGTFVMNSMWSVNMGISKKLPGDKGKLTLSFDDIFKTNVWQGESTFGGLFMNINGGWDSRRVRFAASYNFGSQANSKMRRRETGLEDVQGRIKSSGN